MARSAARILRRAVMTGAALVVPLAPTAARGQSAAATEAPLVLTNARIVDAVGGARAGLWTVTVRGRVIDRIDRIDRIDQGPSAVPPGAPGARTIDLGGRYLVPGLIDAHTHIASLDAARRALASGVTTVRSASTAGFQDVTLREMARSGRLAGPDVLASGLFVTPDLGETVLADPRLVPLADGVRTPEALRALVQVDLDHGVDWIKTRGTERAGLPDTDPRKQVYSESQLRVIVEAARARGVPVMAHAHGDEGARAAVLAGVRSIEHGTYLTDTTLRLMQQRGTWLVPTIQTIDDMAQVGVEPPDPVLLLRGRHMVPRLEDAVRRAHAIGVRVATGVDTDYGPTSLPRVAGECAALVRLGYTPLEALRAATTDAAELLGLGGKTGAVTQGLEADLLVLDRNPLVDIGALADVLMVVSNGRVAVNRFPFGIEANGAASSRRSLPR
jgi:imidazolonepropionase-like amidohydrolase